MVLQIMKISTPVQQIVVAERVSEITLKTGSRSMAVLCMHSQKMHENGLHAKKEQIMM